MLLDATMEEEKGKTQYQHKLCDICKIFYDFSIPYKRPENILEDILQYGDLYFLNSV